MLIGLGRIPAGGGGGAGGNKRKGSPRESFSLYFLVVGELLAVGLVGVLSQPTGRRHRAPREALVVGASGSHRCSEEQERGALPGIAHVSAGGSGFARQALGVQVRAGSQVTHPVLQYSR